MANIIFDFNKITGKIKPMNSVGQPPYVPWSDAYMHYLTDANITYSRLHDVGGTFGGNLYVDIPNIFRDFSADENDPSAYDFTFTDILIKAVFDADCEPIFRLGVSIENYSSIKAYRIYPPTDYDKWARICEHIIMHYREGWADGFNYDITYWEIWNEPDFEPEREKNQMWLGSAEDFYRLYAVTASHLKKRFGDDIKIGGYGSCGFYGIFADPKKYGMDVDLRVDAWAQDISHVYHIDFFRGFLSYINEHNAPLDFFSWHTYCNVPDAEKIADYTDKVLTEYGRGDIETMLNEWNPTPGNERHGSSEACANAAAMMCAMQNKKTSILCFYDARMRASDFGSLFNPLTAQPYSTYYAFAAFGEMLALGNQTYCQCDTDGIYTVSAADGANFIAMISNISGKDEEISANIGGKADVYLIDWYNLYTKTKLDASHFTLKNNQTAIIKGIYNQA